MARVFNGSTQYLYSSTIPVSGYPFSFACWFNADNITANNVLFAISDNTVNTRYTRILASGANPGDPLRLQDSDATGSAGNTDSTSGYSANTWHHAAGTFNSSTRTVFLDGGNSATNTESRTWGSNNRFSVGAWLATSVTHPMDGAILWPAIWNVALTDDEVASLAARANPAMIRPDALVFFAPLGGFDGDHDIDIVGGLSLTAVNSPTWADDSPSGLIYPSVPIVGLGTAGGGGTTIDATTASLHITALAATVTPTAAIAATTAAADVSPLPVSVAVGTSVAASVAALSVASLPASVSAGVLIEATTAAINAAPLAATVSAGTAVTASTAAMQVDGLAASVAAGVSITATVAQVTIAGNAASVASGVSVSAAVAALHCTALPASVSVGTSVSASTAAVEMAGNAASVSASVSVQSTTGIVRIASHPVSITFGGRIRRPHILTGGQMSHDWGFRTGGAL